MSTTRTTAARELAEIAKAQRTEMPALRKRVADLEAELHQARIQLGVAERDFARRKAASQGTLVATACPTIKRTIKALTDMDLRCCGQEFGRNTRSASEVMEFLKRIRAARQQVEALTLDDYGQNADAAIQRILDAHDVEIEIPSARHKPLTVSV